MPCWVAIALLMESTIGWRHTESTGRYPKTIRPPHRSITSAKAVKRSIVGPRDRSRWQFPCVASGSDRSKFGPARTTRMNDRTRVRELNLDFASWNQIGKWLRRVGGVGAADLLAGTTLVGFEHPVRVQPRRPPRGQPARPGRNQSYRHNHGRQRCGIRRLDAQQP